MASVDQGGQPGVAERSDADDWLQTRYSEYIECEGEAIHAKPFCMIEC